jgi:TolA-binding protein
VRSAQDVGASNTSVLTELLKRIRQLEADVRDLRGKP